MTAPPHALNLVDAAASGPASFPAPLAAVAHPSFEKTTDPVALAEIARQVRIKIVRTIAQAGLGHVGGDLSVTDILTTLYFGVLNVDPAAPTKPDRDRFILSKGHCAAAFYSVLSLRGFFDPAAVDTFMKPLAALNGHPNRRKIPGVEANTGPLGHGLPIGVGTAVGATIAGQNWRTFVVLGDGELQEGSNWEAAMAAGHRKLSNLTAIVDRNRFQQGAGTEATNTLEPLADKFRAFGWEAIDVDGHDTTALLDVLAARGTDRPRAVIAKTYKGRGVSFMEDRVEWHHKVPSAEQVEIALKELSL
jgi:transketolase